MFAACCLLAFISGFFLLFALTALQVENAPDAILLFFISLLISAVGIYLLSSTSSN